MKKKTAAILLWIVIIALLATGCGRSSADGLYANGEAIGSGDITIHVEIVDKNGNETQLKVRTNKSNVGDALEEYEIISGEETNYGLFVTSVNGMELDFEEDELYWALYVDGQYSSYGVDSVEVVDGTTYLFKAE